MCHRVINMKGLHFLSYICNILTELDEKARDTSAQEESLHLEDE